jgi:hypothetical protein
LTGLTFIVITISSDTRRDNTAAARLMGLRAFITPTVVHFGAALWLSALMSVPGHTAISLSWCLGITGLLGLWYCSQVVHWMWTIFSEYQAVVSDWIWNAILPVVSYLSIALAGMLFRGHIPQSLYTVGGITLLLLFIGIHNAWDVVAWTTTERHAIREQRKQAEVARSADQTPAA